MADGVGVDGNGNAVGALLWVDDNLSELEIYGYDGDVFGMPTIESFELA